MRTTKGSKIGKILKQASPGLLVEMEGVLRESLHCMYCLNEIIIALDLIPFI